MLGLISNSSGLAWPWGWSTTCLHRGPATPDLPVQGVQLSPVQPAPTSLPPQALPTISACQAQGDEAAQRLSPYHHAQGAPMMVPRQTAVGRLGSLGPALEGGRPEAAIGSPSSMLGIRMSARSGVRQNDMMGTWLLCSDSGSSAAFRGRSKGGSATSRHNACQARGSSSHLSALIRPR